jgi:peptidoglycan hydrolase CwlO-like protein
LPGDRRPSSASRRPRTWLFVAAGILTLVIPALAVAANSVSRQMEAVRRLEGEISGLDTRYGQAAAAYDGARSRLATVRTRIAQNADALRQAKVEFKQAQGRLAERVLDIYRAPQPSTIELILRSGSLSEATSSVDALERVQRQDGDIVTSVAGARDRMAKARVQLLADQKVAKSEAKEASTRFAQIRSIRAARRGALVSARSRLTTMIAAAQRARDAQRVASLRAAQRRVGGQVSQPAPAPAVAQPPSLTGSGDVAAKLRQIALCESGGNPAAISPSGLYRGKYQFDPQTWKALGGAGSDPAAASAAEQDRVAAIMYGQRGAAAWPVCGR